MEAGEWVEREIVFDSTNDSALFFTFISEGIFYIESGMLKEGQNNQFDYWWGYLIKAKSIDIL
jgi:hypothetical protein